MTTIEDTHACNPADSLLTIKSFVTLLLPKAKGTEWNTHLDASSPFESLSFLELLSTDYFNYERLLQILQRNIP